MVKRINVAEPAHPNHLMALLLAEAQLREARLAIDYRLGSSLPPALSEAYRDHCRETQELLGAFEGFREQYERDIDREDWFE